MSDDDIVDVLIIGAGASGAAAAWNLVDTKMRIVCMEQGGWTNPSDYPTTGRDWEVRAMGAYNQDPNVRKRPEDYPVNDSESPISIANFNGVGGGTIMYAAHFPRFHPSDFRVKSLDGVADDWPIDYETLAPYYAQNDEVTGVSGLDGDPYYPAKQVQMPPVPLGRGGEILAKGFNTKGWHWWPSDAAIATEPYEGRAQCANLGPCMTGCSQGAKASTDITYWPMAIRAGVELRTHCRVREITVNDDGFADGVIYYDQDGVERRQRAEVVILASNGIGTPRILLNSKSKLFPDGLANSSGLVGKNLMLHPYAYVRGTFDEPTDGHMGPLGCCLWSKEFYETDLARGFVRGYVLQSARGEGPVMTATTGIGGGMLPWGQGHHEAFRKRFAHTMSLAAICEDLPEECNTVTLDPELVDSHGIPAPKITYRVSENTQAMLDHGVEKASEVLRAAGAHTIDYKAPARPAGWHLMGTARMGTDPSKSVVNEWGRSHDVKNLFVIDGSVFVTSAGLNPTSTIQALALYITDQMKQRLANLFD